jgi:hypothetical protein
LSFYEANVMEFLLRFEGKRKCCLPFDMNILHTGRHHLSF